MNTQKHRFLSLFNWEYLKEVAQIHAPSGMQFDNQLWSNNPEWLSSTSEGVVNNIFLHHLPSDTSDQITTSGDSNRADLFVITMQP